MFRIERRKREEFPDVRGFADLAREGAGGYTHATEIFVARAPGRLDVMGGIADYSGSLVLPMPIRQASVAGVQRAADGRIRIVSVGNEREYSFEIEADRIGDLYDSHHRGKWYSYIAGVLTVLSDVRQADFSSGARIMVRSDVPIGKGLSSSAAIEVSTMAAACAAFEIEIEPRELAILCQRVENTIVGAACGVMDQMASHCGREGSLLSLLCQPAELGEPVKIPAQLHLWGIDSGVRHSVSGADYSSVRAAAFMGYRMISEAADAVDQWNGYLANISIEEYESKFRGLLPESMLGEQFLDRLSEHRDSVTTVDRGKSYAIRAATEHAIYESDRVKEFAGLLGEADSPLPGVQRRLGELMFASHESYGRCGLSEEGTDLLTTLAHGRRSDGVFGARITGGGSGGTVAILAASDAGGVIAGIAREYHERTRRHANVFHGSGPGCDAYGIVKLIPN